MTAISKKKFICPNCKLEYPLEDQTDVLNGICIHCLDDLISAADDC